MLLKELIKTDYKLYNVKENLSIKGLSTDSRKINNGYVFFSLKGEKRDGRDYIEHALKKGANLIVSDNYIENIPLILVNDIQDALSYMSMKFYKEPQKLLKIIGITGTNGKTTTSFLIKHILEKSFKVGLIGTIQYFDGEEWTDGVFTTPSPPILYNILNRMVEKGVEYVVMEVSSHSLALKRVKHLKFLRAVYTNLTQDHLDFHKSMEDYKNTKAKLFKNLTANGVSIVNLDDPHGEFFSTLSKNVITYGLKRGNIKGKVLYNGISGLRLEIEGEFISSNLVGEYNAYNILAAYATTRSLGLNKESIKNALAESIRVRGRLDSVPNKKGIGIYIDYAHTPDALKNAIVTVRNITDKRVITVFGCGGDRDKKKRPLMGSIAKKLSDLVFVTSDNPRTEDPLKIIEEIVKGINLDNVRVIENRKEAIYEAIKEARKGDVVLIAGKGHENYQIIGEKKYHFDDYEVAMEAVSGI